MRCLLMDLFLVEHHSGLTLELVIEEPMRSALVRQFDRLGSPKEQEAFAKRLARRLSEVLPESLDWDLKEPTRAQLAIAKSLAKRLRCSIPDEALSSRAAMHAFLESHARMVS